MRGILRLSAAIVAALAVEAGLKPCPTHANVGPPVTHVGQPVTYVGQPFTHVGQPFRAAAIGTQKPAAREQPNPEALVLADFQKRIEKYVDMHDELEKGSAKQKETTDPAKIREAQKALAGRIRAARPDARAGDIFTPETRAAFRRLMYPETKGAEGRATKAEMKEDAPTAVPLKVNAEYPEGRPLPTVPANLLANLPQLPEELEYRIVDKHLILRDVNANLIVDYIPNAIR